jgi:hypothetical protein
VPFLAAAEAEVLASSLGKEGHVGLFVMEPSIFLRSPSTGVGCFASLSRSEVQVVEAHLHVSIRVAADRSHRARCGWGVGTALVLFRVVPIKNTARAILIRS